jgi:ferredoxin
MDGMSPSHQITIHWRQENRTITHEVARRRLHPAEL